MKRNLPPLNSELLKLIFDNVYSSSAPNDSVNIKTLPLKII